MSDDIKLCTYCAKPMEGIAHYLITICMGEALHLGQSLVALEAENERVKAEVERYRYHLEMAEKARRNDACTECKGRGEIGYVTETELGPEGDLEVCSTCAGSGSQAVADVIESWGEAQQKPTIDQCLAHRCSKHLAVPIHNANEFTGAECGGCILAELEAARQAAEANSHQADIIIKDLSMLVKRLCTSKGEKHKEGALDYLRRKGLQEWTIPVYSNLTRRGETLTPHRILLKERINMKSTIQKELNKALKGKLVKAPYIKEHLSFKSAQISPSGLITLHFHGGRSTQITATSSLDVIEKPDSLIDRLRARD
jgi:hypothetical protein